MGLPGNDPCELRRLAQAFQDSLKNEWILILAALTAVHIVLGMLYESFIHPITHFLDTAVGGSGGDSGIVDLCDGDFNVIAMIGIILLIGLVKKKCDSDDRLCAGCRRGGKDCRRSRLSIKRVCCDFVPS